MKELGTIFSVYGNEVIVKSNSSNLVSLGTPVYLKNKKLLGYIKEYFGKVKEPFYVIKLKDNHLLLIKNEKVYYNDRNPKKRRK